MTQPNNPFDGTQPPANGQDESTRAIRAINEEDLARPAAEPGTTAQGGSAWTQHPADQTQQGGWGQPAPQQQGGWSQPAPEQQGASWSAPAQQGGWGRPGADGEITEDARSKAFTGNLLAALIGWIGALIGWIMAKDVSPWAKRQNAKAFNFSLANLVINLVVIILGVILLMAGGGKGGLAVIGVLIVYLVPMLVGLIQLVLCLVQAFKAKKGEEVKYPYGIPVLK